VLPDSLEEVAIGYATGSAVTPGCVVDAVQVAVPRGSVIPVDPRCEAGGVQAVGEGAVRWLRSIIR
jgi:hypothetical protein